MALSDYLTNDEWDACFYLSFGQCDAANFGVSLHKAIDALLERGHVFRGLDEEGDKLQQVPSNNAKKILVFMGNPQGINVAGILQRGRRFLKNVAPDLLDETDEEWAEEMKAAKEAKTDG